MHIDKKILYTVSASTLAVLLVSLFIPANGSRIVAALLLIIPTLITFLAVKKRSILSINKRQVLFLMTVIALLYLMLYYLSGLKFGFSKSIYRFNFDTIFRFIVPSAMIITSTELIRVVIRAQNSRLADVLTYFSCVIAEILIYSNTLSVATFGLFMDLVAIAVFPAIISNLLYHYLSRRYGCLPVIVYRLITTLYIYVIPYTPGMSKSLFALINLFVPILIYMFIDKLYEKKRRYALGKKHRFSTVITVAAVAIMISVVMLISNQFRYGTLVIATDSMTGELNRGDAAIFEQYDDQIITEGQVIVFEKDGTTVVHRVVDIKRINGETRYYTMGDANEDLDAGHITDANVIGLVYLKVPYVGFPTLWLRSLFS